MNDNRVQVESILACKVDGEIPEGIASSLQFANDDFVFYRLSEVNDKNLALLESRLPKSFSGILITSLF